MKLRALFITVALCGCGLELPSSALAQSPHYEAHCKEPLPVFTLGEKSNPTKNQEATLCTCIWHTLGGWERDVSKKLAQGKESEVSEMHMRAFPSRFGSAIEKCGGMQL